MIRLLALVFTFTAFAAVNVYAGLPVNETDHEDEVLVGFFDLRERETFVQVTNSILQTPEASVIHVQIFNVGDLCNENNFFDAYTPNDTHVYDLRNILTNDGNPSGVVLPEDAYGIIVFSSRDATNVEEDGPQVIGNVRIQDNNGFEYRTNLNGIEEQDFDSDLDVYTFNYNTENGVTFSDVVGIMLDNVGEVEVTALGPEIWASFDIDIYDLNEVPFSCRNVIFACTDQENPLLSAILEDSGDASVASFEYGINDVIPSSKGAPLLCPNNIISDGLVQLSNIDYNSDEDHAFALFVALNNGNGRGSMDVMWQDNPEVDGDE